MESTCIETIGYISKVETVNAVDHNILPHTLVLEAVEPFPGYHGKNLPSDMPPMYLFLITREKYSFEEISRASSVIRKEFPHNFDAVYGDIKIFNDSYPSIRIMGLNSFEPIAKLQELFEKQGFKFSKNKQLKECAIIKLHKTFNLEEIEDGIFKDLSEPGMNYIQISKKIGWNDFQKISHTIKNNIDYVNFDAALGYFFRHNGVVDMVRIYSKNIDLPYLNSIKKLYNSEIDKL